MVAPSLLVTIPHFFNPEGSGKHGSTHPNPDARIRALRTAILNLWQHLGPTSAVLSHAQNKAILAGPEHLKLSIVVVTTQGKHLVDRLDLPKSLFTHREVEVADPMYLGFECHRILAEEIDQHSWFGFTEDDLVVHDPLLLKKIGWFTDTFGERMVLQPNRYEWGVGGQVGRFYIDGPIQPSMTAPYLDPTAPARVGAPGHGGLLSFSRAANPHSGAFFLRQAQMRRWIEAPWFLDRDPSFAGPLESAATLGLLKTFSVYKTDAGCSDFLQIEHAARWFIGLIGGRIPLG
jgi:hypothetical protein